MKGAMRKPSTTSLKEEIGGVSQVSARELGRYEHEY